MSLTQNLSWLSYKSITIGAGHTIPVFVTGQIFVCKDASAQFMASFGSSEFFPMEAGLGFRLSGGDTFDRITFRNTGASDVTVNYYTGRAEIMDNRVGKLNAQTYLTGHTSTSLTAGATVSFSGVSGSDLRKQIVITNLDASNNLQVLDEDDNVAGTVIPGTAWTIETGGVVQVKNPGASAINYNVGEIWYDLG